MINDSLCPRNAFPAVRKTCEIVTYFDIDCSNIQHIFTRVYFVDLLSSYPLGRSLGGPSEDGVTLLGVAEFLAMEDLEFPVLLDNSVSDDGIVVLCGPEGGR